MLGLVQDRHLFSRLHRLDLLSLKQLLRLQFLDRWLEIPEFQLLRLFQCLQILKRLLLLRPIQLRHL